MPNIQAYWSREAMSKNSMASKVMTRNRFELLLRMLHFADNQDNPGKNLDQGHTTPTSVVMSLFEPILDSGRTLVTDNWYTSVDLAKRLMDRQTYLIGTLRKNRRGLPKDLVNKKLKCGEIAALENQDAGKSSADISDQMTAYQTPLRRTFK
ncbi:unnamed protein product [Acanthoscelides obtectus]|uniref:PiggyBac transposable element-derived protein domain-containing protein n=1 Tax=Acanthoscelides obtectus TaxID=200917 RepID=A0A9P0KQ17_ACAOB|nr:unnamed protein product [Acanthoscelides obtectus]CAK1635902.1 hypothetical protein AOBTE_LOCUS9609 [Acanthoscelides obtectus]